MVGKSIFVSVVLVVVCCNAVSRAQQQPCTYFCAGYVPTDILTRAHLETAPYVLVDVAGSPPVWWDASWLTHLTNACGAFAAAGMNVTVLSTGFQNIEVILVGHQQFWPEGASTSHLAVTEDFLGNGYVSEKKIWINLFYWGDSAWYEEAVGGPTYPQHDLTTVLVHEIGHAFGFYHLPDGLEHCSVMTMSTAPTEVSRSLKTFDVNGLLCYYPSVAVGDIQSFGVQGAGHNVNVSFTIQGGANPNEYAAVYVSDNPSGPARLIDVLTAHANLLPGTNSWVDSYRLAPPATYYYWLDYNSLPPADLLRSPDDLYAAGSPATVTGSGGASFDPPDITDVTDVPFDLGGRVTVNWQASADEASIDYYNIYRSSYPPGHPEQGEWKYLVSVDPGVTSFVDELLAVGWINHYKVSAAHHGTYALQDGRGNKGIWNAMSSVVAGVAVHNFWNDQIALLGDDTLRVCPAGDDDTVEAEAIIWGSNIAPTVGVPAEMIECLLQYAGASSCDGEVVTMDGPTDANGRTTLTASSLGGSGRLDLVFRLADSPAYVPTFLDTLTVYVKSPDENGNGIVDVVDFALFAQSFTSPPKSYSWARDFTSPFGTISLGDFAHLGSHNNHSCESGVRASTVVPLSGASVEVSFTETVSADNTRLLKADISVTNVSPFKAMLMNLRSDNPSLDFRGWEAGAFEGRVLVAPVVRNGVHEVAIGVLDGENMSSNLASLGRLVFAIKPDVSFELASSDLETRVADVLSVSGTVARMRSAGAADGRPFARVVENDLAQNRPNPFNPTTTLSYSISRGGRVELMVYGVDGKLVRTLVDHSQPADRYDITWDGTDDRGQRVSSGVYFYQLKTSGFIATRKMVLLK